MDGSLGQSASQGVDGQSGYCGVDGLMGSMGRKGVDIPAGRAMGRQVVDGSTGN